VRIVSTPKILVSCEVDHTSAPFFQRTLACFKRSVELDNVRVEGASHACSEYGLELGLGVRR
jgi:hypothetical protein